MTSPEPPPSTSTSSGQRPTDSDAALLTDELGASRSRVRLGYLLPWLGGARPDVLRRCPGERSLFGGLGLGVALTGIFGGAAATLAISYTLGVPASRAWPAGLLWALVIMNIDRLLLMVTGSRRRLLAMLPRLAISLFLGVLIAEPLTLRIFQPEINAQLVITQEQQQAAQLQAVASTFQPKIAADYRQIAALNSQLAAMGTAIDQARLKAACEAQQTNCSTTHLLGCGPYCHYYQRQAAALQRRYATASPAIRGQIAADQADAAALTTQQDAARTRLRSAIAASTGWLARKHALDQLQRTDAGVNETVWLVRLAIVLVDLAPLIIKFLLVLFGKSVYEEVAEAASGRERVEAHRLAELARLDRGKITRRADADDEIDEAVVEAHKEERIAAAYGQHQAPDPRPTGRRAPPRPRVRALNLADFAEGSRVHEKMPIPIAAPLTRLAWIGAGLLAALAAGVVITRDLHATVTDGWIALAVLPAAALAVYTRGFRRAPSWAHRAAFATGMAGLALPVLVLALNL